MPQYSVGDRTSKAAALNTDIGTNAVIKIFTGSAPATCATADTGTMLVQFAGNATAFGAASAGVLTANAVANATAAAAGTAGYFRIYPSVATTTNAVMQGTVYQSTPLVTNALTAANSNVLNFAATTGVVAGMSVSGTGIVAGTTVLATTGTTVTISCATMTGVANTTTITFGGDMTATNSNIASGQTCTFPSFVVTEFGA